MVKTPPSTAGGTGSTLAGETKVSWLQTCVGVGASSCFPEAPQRLIPKTLNDKCFFEQLLCTRLSEFYLNNIEKSVKIMEVT